MAYLGTPIDTTNQFQSLQGKRFSGNGSTTAFTLDIAPSSVFDIEVFVENVRQDPNSAYSISGTTLTFSAAPPSGTNNIYVIHQAKAVGTIDVPASGVVPASLASNIISGQTELAATPADTDEFLISDAGTIKRVDYSLIKTGITMADQWRLTADNSMSSSDFNDITSNWERNDNSGFGQLGTGMTESSGIFTFPSTGIYLIKLVFSLKTGVSADAAASVSISTTTDNSSYTRQTDTYESAEAGTKYATGVADFIFDVTSTSTHKAKFQYYRSQSGTIMRGSTALNITHVTFIRLGDT